MIRTPTVLVVEDEPAVREVTALTLQANGYAVYVAKDGVEAMSVLAANPDIDLMITDVIMPKMTGFVLAREARRMRPELRVLYVSGYPDEGMKNDEGITLDEIFRKPYRGPDLVAEVERALGRTIGQ